MFNLLELDPCPTMDYISVPELTVLTDPFSIFNKPAHSCQDPTAYCSPLYSFRIYLPILHLNMNEYSSLLFMSGPVRSRRLIQYSLLAEHLSAYSGYSLS